MRLGPSLRGLVALCLSLSLAVTAVACGGDPGSGDGDGPVVQTPEGSSAESASGGAASSESGGSSRIRGDTVVIDMDEYVIEVPDTLPAGPLVFRVRNMGFEEHNLEVHRDSLLFELARPLNPRETMEAEVSLEPGPYRLICTVSGHEGRGMSESVTVVEATGPASSP